MAARSIILDTRPFVGFLEVIPLGVLEVVPLFSQESPKIRVLMARYASCAQRADACVVRLSELQIKLHPRAQALTSDGADFRSYRRNRSERIPIIAPSAGRDFRSPPDITHLNFSPRLTRCDQFCPLVAVAIEPPAPDSRKIGFQARRIRARPQCAEHIPSE